MVKKLLCVFLFLVVPVGVFASSTSLVKVGNNYYDTLEEAIAMAGSSDVIKLISDVSLDETLIIDKTINIDLNGNDILSPSTVFRVQGGTLNLSGVGTLKETEPNYGVIRVIGSDEASDSNYSVVNVGSGVTLDGWAGIFITHEGFKSYGVVVNSAGKINAVTDVNGGTGAGVYVNGNIKDETNNPIVNILDGAEIMSTGNGLYIAGYSTFNIGKAYIYGVESGIGIKSGILNIDGAEVVCDGADMTPTEGNTNGILSSGTAIQIESNDGYAGNIELNISDGKFVSKNSYVIYEYIGRGSKSLVKSMNISNGTFISESKNVFNLSDSFIDMHNGFISGGEYSSDPVSYLKSGYSTSLDSGMYKVISSTLKQVSFFGNNGNSSENVLEFIGILISIGLICLLLYFNRVKLAGVFKKYC